MVAIPAGFEPATHGVEIHYSSCEREERKPRRSATILLPNS